MEDAGQWFAELISCTSDPVVGVGTDGRVRFVNAVAERCLGRRAAELVGTTADTEIPSSQVKRRQIVRGPAGADIGVLIVLDPQDRRPCDTIGLMAAGVGHQLNNMLQAIRGHADVLAARLPQTPRAWRDSVDGIVDTGERAAKLVAQMTSVARSEKPRARSEDVSEVVRRAARWLPRVLPQNVMLTVDAAAPAPAWVDPDLLAVVIEHLAHNAADAMPDGGRLSISCRTRAAGEGDPELAGRPMITVEDTGHGIPPAAMERLFEPFFSTRKAGGHLGLGLAAVHELVHRHGGLVEVDSRPGTGTLVKITLSATPPALPAEPTLPALPPEALGPKDDAEGLPDIPGKELHGTETILVAEDNDAVRELILTELRELGYQTLEASRGDEAVDVANAFGGHIHMLVSDVMMPGMGGVALGKALRQTRPDLHIIFLSGYVSLDLNERMGRELGATFVSKPFSFGVLARKVRELLSGGALKRA